MALFLRGNVWWYEIRKRTMRIVKSTGLRRENKRDAEALYQTALLIANVKPPRSVAEKLLDAVYAKADAARMRVDAVWSTYEAWFKGKSKTVTDGTWKRRKARFSAFLDFCRESRVQFADEVTVEVARRFVAALPDANKTVRVKAMDISCVWEGCAEMVPGMFNPWPAACPADDGSSKTRDVFTDVEAARVLEAAKEVGHGWYGVCLAGLWTGQRYGDVATLEWGSAEWARRQKTLVHGIVDMDERVIVLDPSKTRRHCTRISIPISDELAEFLRTFEQREGLLFPAHAAYHASCNHMDPPFSDVLRVAGVTEGYHDFHSFRHTFRSRLGEAGVSDSTANRFGGWTSARMGAHYDHAAHLEEMRAAIDAIKKTSAP